MRPVELPCLDSLSFLGCLPLYTVTAVDDQMVLQHWFEAMDRPATLVRRGWGSPKRVAEWGGVTAGVDGRVTKLKLAWNTLPGS